MKKITSILLAALFPAMAAAAFNSYSDLYVIGDSLNDIDTGKSTSAPDINGTQGQILNEILFNRPLIDFHYGGNSFAMLGREIHKELDEMLDWGHFDRQNPGKDRIYFVFLGENDIGTEAKFLTLNNMGRRYNDEITSTLRDAVKMFGNNGQNTVIVSTLPDSSLTPLVTEVPIAPIFSLVQYIDYYQDLGVLYPPLEAAYHALAPLRDNELVSRLSAKLGIFTNRALREFTLNYPAKTPGEAPEEYVKRYNDDLFAHTLLGKIPFFAAGRDYLFRLLRDYTNLFNDTYISKIQELHDENIVILDLGELFKDMINYPEQFGIDRIVGTACGNGTLSAQKRGLCNSDSPYYDGEHVYAWADIIHPSGEMQAALANYVLAVLSAPVQFSHLATATFSTLKNLRRSITNKNQELLARTPNVGEHALIAELNFNRERSIKQQGIDSKTYNSPVLNLGLTYQTHANNSLGALLSLNFSNTEHLPHFSYHTQAYYLSLWDLYRWSDTYWSSVAFGFGHSAFKKVRRDTLLIKGNMPGVGKTSATSGYVNVQTGYRFPINTAFSHSGYLGFTHEETHLKGYTEENSHGAAMFFKGKSFKQDSIALGARLNYERDNTQFYLGGAVNRSLNNERSTIHSGLKKFRRTFKREVVLHDKRWLNVEGGVNYKFNPQNTANLAVGVNYGNESKAQYHVTLGWKRQL